MTPLNCILAQSKVVGKRIAVNHALLKEYFVMKKDLVGLKQQEITDLETYKMVQAIEQSGKCMWYYNTN
jgi:hypothetical protein